MKANETVIRVRYSETDQMGVVYHANYLNWFEIGRTEMIREFGVPYAQFETRGLLLPLVHAELEFKSPARYDDLILIRTRVTHFTGLRLHFYYEIIRKESGVLLVSGETHHVWVNRDFRPVNLKKVWPEMFSRLSQEVE